MKLTNMENTCKKSPKLARIPLTKYFSSVKEIFYCFTLMVMYQEEYPEDKRKQYLFCDVKHVEEKPMSELLSYLFFILTGKFVDVKINAYTDQNAASVVIEVSELPEMPLYANAVMDVVHDFVNSEGQTEIETTVNNLHAEFMDTLDRLLEATCLSYSLSKRGNSIVISPNESQRRNSKKSTSLRPDTLMELLIKNGYEPIGD